MITRETNLLLANEWRANLDASLNITLHQTPTTLVLRIVNFATV